MEIRNAFALEMLARSPLLAVLPEAFFCFLTRPTPDSAEIARLTTEMEANFRPTVTGRESNRVAVIPVRGLLSRGRSNWFGSGYDSIVDAADDAANDVSIKRVVLAVDSPGGEVMGCAEAGDAIAALAKVKPVSALVEGQSASAAYWLTSQATDIAALGTGEVGSVGIKTQHFDFSRQLDAEGITVTEITAGKHKSDWSRYRPLPADAQEDMQARVDAEHSHFLAAVDAGRGSRATADIKAARFGEGRMFSAPVALQHGLIDRIQTPKAFYQAILPAPEAPENHGLRRAMAARLEMMRAVYGQ